METIKAFAKDLAPYLVFASLAAGLLVIAGMVLRRVTENTMRLILLGVVVGVAAIGYGTLTPGDSAKSAAELASMLMRIAVIMVLGGILGWLLMPLQDEAPRKVVRRRKRDGE